MAKVLITGGAGFIGQRLTDHCLKQGLDVRVFDLVRTRNPGVKESLTGSILDPYEVSRALRGCDYVIHAAAALGVGRTETQRLECLYINIQGAVNVLDAAVKERIKKVLLRPGQLRDFDGDGWLEYVPAGIDVPYVYYDSRIARLPTTTSLAMDFNTGLAAPGLPYTATGVSGAGFPQPYWKVSPTPATALPIHDHYQLLSCGVDSNYGRNLTTRGLRIFPPTIQSLESAERDNLANFTESRLDAALQQ